MPTPTSDLYGVRLLASGRIGRLTAIATKTGNPVYRGIDGSLLCCHGEVRSYVGSRLAGKKVEEESGSCDCQNTDGLFTYTDTTPKPPVNVSLFELLGETGAEERIVDGRPIRRACTSGCLASVWIGLITNVVCEHANGRTRRDKPGGCGCIVVIPRRRHSAFKHCRKSGTKSRVPKKQESSSGDDDKEPMQTGM